eukprot:TRINITY_DN7984_c1_g2_i2.p1 TRINITY_DN7984_c1_g2~~TRINITY_DN7984_c1_g2_i2.p1  ORF type:complete len:921 (-),score=249.32 TRINITY_DN7984_c1_g2_i2:88-2850(-)
MWRGYLSMRDSTKKWTKVWIEMSEDFIQFFIKGANNQKDLIKEWLKVSLINVIRDPEIQSYKQWCFELIHFDESIVFSAESEIQKDHFLASLERFSKSPSSVTIVPATSRTASSRGIRTTQSLSSIPISPILIAPNIVAPVVNTTPIISIPQVAPPPLPSQPVPALDLGRPASPIQKPIGKPIENAPVSSLTKSATMRRRAGTVGRSNRVSSKNSAQAQCDVQFCWLNALQPKYLLKVGRTTTVGDILQEIATKVKTEPFMLILQDVDMFTNKEVALANHINILEQMATWITEDHRFVIQEITGISESLMRSPIFRKDEVPKQERRRTLSFFSSPKKSPSFSPPSPRASLKISESDEIKVKISPISRKPSFMRPSSPKALQKLTDEELNNPPPISILLLYPGELQKMDHVIYRIGENNTQTPHWFYGTNFRFILIKPDQSKEIAFSVPWTNISRTKKIGGKTDKIQYSLKIFCKNLLQVHLGFRRIRHERKKFLKNISELGIPSSVAELFAFQYRPPLRNVKLEGWELYNPMDDYRRVGLPDSQWRISQANSEFQLSETYPRELVVPAEISDDELKKVAEFRSKGRIPVCIWKHPGNGSVLMRAAQPMVGLVRSRSAVDEKLLAEVTNPQVEPASPLTQLKNSGKINLIIVDCRPKVNAQANALKGLGYELSGHYDNLQLEFANIDNIHVMRESLIKLSEEELESSGWLHHIRKVLSCASRIANLLNSDSISVLVHCSDGWDRTGQISALSEMMLDGHYRTIIGFCTIIEKEFLNFGHKIATRSGHESGIDGKDKEISPIVLQFLDATWQMMQQFPTAFQFDAKLLLFILDHLHSCLFGTFLYNSTKERSQAKLSLSTISLWTFIFSFPERFINPSYEATTQVIIPSTDLSSIRFWEDCYHRWKDPKVTGIENFPPTNWT